MSECVVCGTTESLHRHHIDGDRSNDFEDNIAVLCARHHRSVHGDGSERFKEEKVLELKEELPEIVEKTVECECGYSWESKTINDHTTCPNCGGRAIVEGNDAN